MPPVAALRRTAYGIRAWAPISASSRSNASSACLVHLAGRCREISRVDRCGGRAFAAGEVAADLAARPRPLETFGRPRKHLLVEAAPAKFLVELVLIVANHRLVGPVLTSARDPLAPVGQEAPAVESVVMSIARHQAGPLVAARLLLAGLSDLGTRVGFASQCWVGWAAGMPVGQVMLALAVAVVLAIAGVGLVQE